MARKSRPREFGVVQNGNFGRGSWDLTLHSDRMVVRNAEATFGSIEEFQFPGEHAEDLYAALQKARGSAVVKAWFARDGILPVESLWRLYRSGRRFTIRRVFRPEYAIVARSNAFLLNYWELPSLLAALRNSSRVGHLPAPSGESGREHSQPAGSNGDDASDMKDESEPGRPSAPWEDHAHARWLDSETSRHVWEAVLGQAHLDGASCPLPDGQVDVFAGQRVRFVLDHQEPDAAHVRRAFESTVQQSRSGWQLTGIDWPAGLRPGAMLTVTWDEGDRLAVACTAPLHQPVNIDGVDYFHHYDPRVVTRELKTGNERRSPYDRLTDPGWVTYTLRRLGYLFEDGSVILTEAALAGNCRTLGMPPARSDRIGEAVEQMVRNGQITRLRGSVDAAGYPSYPARAGQTRRNLLRYSPPVEPLQPAASSPGWSARGADRQRNHWVSGFVRKLPPGAEPSPEQLELHHEAVRAAQVVDRPLNPGYTFVRSHYRRK